LSHEAQVELLEDHLPVTGTQSEAVPFCTATQVGSTLRKVRHARRHRDGRRQRWVLRCADETPPQKNNPL
jgi:hypothetical protein